MTKIQFDRLPAARLVERRALAVLGALLLMTTIVLAGPLSAGVVLGPPTGGSASSANAASALQGLALSPASRTASLVHHFTLDIMVNCGANADGAAITVTFEPTYLQVVSVVEDTSQFPNILANTHDNGTGTIRYDAGALLTCHQAGTCPSGIVRAATITFRATALTVPTTYVGISGQVTWNAALIFDGAGGGSTITVLPTPTPTPRDIRLAPASLTTRATQHFSLDVMADCGANADGVAVAVTFDPTHLQVVSVTEDTAQFASVLLNTYDNGTGTMRYDAGAPLTCHHEGTCPSGLVRIATITFRAVEAMDPTTFVSVSGQVTWSGAYVFDGPGSGSTITILPPPTPTPPAHTLRLPMIMRTHLSP